MILILNFGSQLTHLIARRFRELGVYSEIKLPYDVTDSELDKCDAIVLSGGPNDVNAESITFNKYVFSCGKPILGICYGHQIIAHQFGGSVVSSDSSEYGETKLVVLEKTGLFEGLNNDEIVWMNHGDTIGQPPVGFKTIGTSPDCKHAAFVNEEKNIYSVLFHPEVHHTKHGMEIFENFINLCDIKKDWKVEEQKDRLIDEIKTLVGEESVVMGVSGGVDSLVGSFLIERAIGKRVFCVYVDTGLMRKDETQFVKEMYDELGFDNFEVVDASSLFLGKLKGVTDPEEKRKIIGHTFIEVFEKEVEKLKEQNFHIKFLGQGTIYPDRIESAAPSKTADKIKSHHNLTLPEKMSLKLVEPLSDLYKDEVRLLGKELGIKKEFLDRHPFPGPGLAIRILGDIDEEKLVILREADDIFISELKSSGEYKNTWQALAALIPVKTVGVMGDHRTYEYMIALRAVTSMDAMTADWAKLPNDLLQRISNRIINEVKGVNRVVYDITQKPPGTIEYE
jgi:GMP synthase (glutamine-hydrolysing)